MNDSALVGKCGLYCGACCIYRAERDDARWREKLAEAFKCELEKIACQGCGALTPESWGYDCDLVACLREKGYDYCFECADYDARSCEKYEKLAKGYLEEDGVDIRKSLAMIKKVGVREWLDDMKRRYACEHCGKPLGSGAKKCHHCGGEVKPAG